MALADELPDEAIEAFKRTLLTKAQQRQGKTVEQLRVKDEAQLRDAIAAAIGKVPLGRLVGAGVTATVVDTGVMGVAVDEPEIPDGWAPEGILVLVRGTDPEGNRSIFWRQGGDVSLWEMVGMLECAGDAVREQIAAARAGV
jgi:hypothetical protein